jgi:hypothetical protein
MNTLHTYGDSYVTNFVNGNKVYWTNLIADGLTFKHRNHGLSGTSTEYSIFKLLTDINDDRHNSGDVVLFSLSSVGRLTFLHQVKNPATASLYRYIPQNFNFDDRSPQHTWYYENKKHLDWYEKNIDFDVQKFYHESCIHTIRNYAETRPDITVVLFQLDEYDIKFPMVIPKNLLIPKLTMASISNLELAISYDQFTKNTEGFDPRVNHLSPINAKILADLVVESVKLNKIDNITLDKFQSKIYDRPILVRADYDNYIQRELLVFRPYVASKIK